MGEFLKDLKKLVEDNYDITVLNINKVKNVYKITGVEGDFCLKQVKYNFLRFKHILEVIDYLKKNEFDNILDIILTYEDEKYVEYKNIFFYMTKWLESRELNYSNQYDLIRASQHIAKFHNYSNGFAPSEDTDVDIRYMKWIQVFDKKINDLLEFKEIIEKKKDLTLFDKIYKQNIDKNISLSNEAVENLYKFNYKEVMKETVKKNYVCHHDLANHNLLLDQFGKIYFIDFDYVIIDTYLHDLGSFITRSLKYGRWNDEKFQIVLKSYKDVKHISKKELLILMSFILFPNDFWQLGIQYYNEKIYWKEEKFIRRLSRIEEDREDRKNFIKRVILK